MSTGSTTQTIEPGIIPENSGLEIWRNTTAGRVGLIRLGDYGRERRERIEGGRQFTITPGERRMNQNRANRPSMDVFTNGVLLPVVLLPDEPDTATLLRNPNIVTEPDMAGILKLKGESFLDRIATITNVSVVTSMIEMARQPKHKVQVAEYEALQAHRSNLEKAVAVEQREPEAAGGARDRAPRPVTPR
jgi:hypothetical protein